MSSAYDDGYNSFLRNPSSSYNEEQRREYDKGRVDKNRDEIKERARIYDSAENREKRAEQARRQAAIDAAATPAQRRVGYGLAYASILWSGRLLFLAITGSSDRALVELIFLTVSIFLVLRFYFGFGRE